MLATFEVTTLLDAYDPADGVTSLREAIELANATRNADEITFADALTNAGPGKILLTRGELLVTESLRITGPGQNRLTIDANQQSRVVNIEGGAINVTLSGLTITGGQTTDSDEIINGVRETTNSGGGVRFESGGSLTFSNVTLTGNSTNGDRARGGAIFTRTGNLFLTNSTLSNNETSGFGAFGGAIASSSGSIAVTNSTVSTNRTNGSFGFGGGIFTDSGNVTLVGSTVSGNSTADDAPGGGIYSQSGNVTLLTSTLSGNVTGDAIPGGIGGDGGGIYSVYGNVMLTNSTLSNNSTIGDNADGGGIFTRAGHVTLTGSTLSGNSTMGAASHGGGIFTSTGNVTLTNSTLSGNQTLGINSDGGALWLNNSLVTIRNSTITGNRATGAGGGLWILSDYFDKSLTIHNSIIAGNTDNRTAPDFTAPMTPVTNLEVKSSLIGNNLGTSLVASATADASGNLVGSPTTIINPQLGPLQHNGGSTLTHGLLATSPAIDAGDGSLVPGGIVADQRGFSRTSDLPGIANATSGDGTDIGAFEMVGVSIAAAAAPENTGPLGFIVSVSHAIPVGSSVSVQFNTSDVTNQAIAGIDYTAISNQTVVFTGGGALTKTVIVPLIDDTLFEANETFTATISNPFAAFILLPSATGTIANDDAPPSVTLAVDNASIAEASGVATITATLSEVSSVPVTLDLGFSGTATFGEDYVRTTAQLVIPPGQMTDTVMITAVQDALVEANETIIVNIANLIGATEATPQTVVLAITNSEPLDFGDAPSPYPVTLASSGARHVIGDLFLGNMVDFELEGQPSALANGDGIDDDGIARTASQFTSEDSDTRSSFAVTASAPGQLDAWIDFNQDGDWTDNGEQIFTSVSVVGGINVLSYTIPAGAIAGDTFARFRLSTSGDLSPTGPAADGEVEDYLFSLVDSAGAPGVIVDVVGGSILLTLDSEDLVIRSGDTELFRASAISVGSIQVNGTGADDTITIDYASGLVLPSGGINIDGAGGTNTIVIQGDGALDLTDPMIVLRDIDAIELFSDAANKVTIDAVAITQNSPTRRAISFTAGPREQIEVVDAIDWRMIDPVIVDGRYLITAQRLNPGTETIRVDSARPYRNFLQVGDVNNSGNVSASDALEIVFELNSPRFSNAAGDLFDPTGLSSLVTTYLDVNGDGKVSASDALDVINILFQQSLRGSGEGEQFFESPVQEVPVPSDFVAIDRIPKSMPIVTDTPQPSIHPTRIVEAASSNPTSSKVTAPQEPQDRSSESIDEAFTDAEFLKSLIAMSL